MKKQFTLLLVTLLGMMGFAANAQISVTFDVLGEGSVSVCSLGTTTELAKVSQGKTTVTLPGYSNSSFTLVPDANTEIENAVNLDYNDYGTKNSNGTWTINRVYGGDTWTITVKSKSGVDPTPTVKTTILNLLSDANVELYCSNPWGKIQTLQKGENVVEIPNKSYYIAAIGVTNTSNLVVKANGEGNPLYVYGAAPFDSRNGVSVLFNSATAADSYTIEVIGQSEVPQTKNFTINLTGKAVLKYQNSSATWEEKALIAGTNNVSVPATVTSLVVVALNDYTLESCINKEGVSISPTTNYGLPGYPKVFKLPQDNLSESYTIVTKAPAPAVKTIVLDVLTADADIVLFNKSSWTKEKNLSAGENIVEIPATEYYIIANGVTDTDRLIIKDPDENALTVTDAQSFSSSVKGVAALFNSDTAPAKYTIEVKEALITEPFKFTVSLNGKAQIKYQNESSGWEEISLAEGGNRIELPRAVTEFYFVATDDYILESCIDFNDNPYDIFNSMELGQTYRISTANLSKLYVLTTKAPAPTVKTIILDLLSDAEIVLWDNDSWTMVKTLNKGENTIEITASEYFIVANGVNETDRLIVKNPANGDEPFVNSSMPFDNSTNGVSVLFRSISAPEKYTIEIVDPLLYGDANDNGRVAIDDVVSEVLYILENDPRPFNFKKADVNNDGSISLDDVIKTVDIVLSNPVSPTTGSMVSTATSRDLGDIPMKLGEVTFVDGKGVLPISLGDINEITALQGDLTLPEGVTVTDISLAHAQVDGSYNVDYRELSATDVRFTVYSQKLETIEPNEPLLNVALSCSESFTGGKLSLSDIMLTDTKAKAQEYGTIETTVPDPWVPTEISTFTTIANLTGANVYNVQGTLLMRNASRSDFLTLSPGLYVIRCGTYTTKIIIK